jgi:hypothetical protein
MVDRAILADNVIARSIRGQVVFMSKAHNDVLTLNETASFIVESLGAASSLADCSARVMQEFKIDDASQVERDIRSLLVSLRERGIVTEEAIARFLDE